jgi:hypothetical protein
MCRRKLLKFCFCFDLSCWSHPTMENKNLAKSDCGCDPYLLSLVETTQGQESAVRKSNRTGLLLASVTGGAAIILSAVCFPFVSPALRRVS